MKLKLRLIEFSTRFDWLIFFAFGGEEVIDEDDSEPDPEPEVDECRPVEPVDIFDIELFEVNDNASDDASLRWVQVGLEFTDIR